MSNYACLHLNETAAPLLVPSVGSAMRRYFDPNDSGIQRCDREDTGDNEARPDEIGSGGAQATVDPSAFGGTSSIGQHSPDVYDIDAERADYEGLEITTADDGRLGLTNTGRVPADDWAADTGETRTPESD